MCYKVFISKFNIMASTRYVDPGKLTFGEFQMHIHKSLIEIAAALDANIKDSCKILKLEHFDDYKAAIIYHNKRCFPAQKKYISSFFVKDVIAPLSTEKALEDLNEGLPEMYNFKDIIRWIARQDIISTMETFDMSSRDVNISQPGKSRDVIDRNSSYDDKQYVVSEMQSDSSSFHISERVESRDDIEIDSTSTNSHDLMSEMKSDCSDLNVSKIIDFRDDTDTNFSCNVSNDIMSEIGVDESECNRSFSDDDSLIRICHKVDAVIAGQENENIQGFY
jgi:hypothetical protein